MSSGVRMTGVGSGSVHCTRRSVAAIGCAVTTLAAVSDAAGAVAVVVTHEREAAFGCGFLADRASGLVAPERDGSGLSFRPVDGARPFQSRPTGLQGSHLAGAAGEHGFHGVSLQEA